MSLEVKIVVVSVGGSQVIKYRMKYVFKKDCGC